MQKIKLILFLFASLISTATFAQGKMQIAKIKQRLITELKIDNAKADSVIAIAQDFYTNARSVRSSTMKDDEKKQALQKSRKEEVARLRTHLNNDQIKKLQQIIQEVKEERQQHKAGKDSASVH